MSKEDTKKKKEEVPSYCKDFLPTKETFLGHKKKLQIVGGRTIFFPKGDASCLNRMAKEKKKNTIDSPEVPRKRGPERPQFEMGLNGEGGSQGALLEPPGRCAGKKGGLRHTEGTRLIEEMVTKGRNLLARQKNIQVNRETSDTGVYAEKIIGKTLSKKNAGTGRCLRGTRSAPGL